MVAVHNHLVHAAQKLFIQPLIVICIALASGCNLLAEDISLSPQYPDHSCLLIYRDADGGEHPVQTSADWARRRRDILDGMQQAMGKLPDRKSLPPFDVEVLERVKARAFERRKISMVVEKGDRLSSYLFVPTGLEKEEKVAAMLALHPTHPMGKGDTAGLSGRKDRSYGLELAKRGYVVLVPDYPSFGDEKDYDFKNDRYVSGTMKGIFNHMRCVDYLCSLEMVDPQRIGVIGHSLGGHNAMFLGVSDIARSLPLRRRSNQPLHVCGQRSDQPDRPPGHRLDR